MGSILRVWDEETKRWIGIPAIVGPKGNDGNPGKSAYEYAKDGGYEGTEEDFSKKLSSDLPANGIFYVNITPTSESIAVSDKTFMEIQGAYSSGKDVKCRFDTFILPLCFIQPNNQIIFGGATGNQTVLISAANSDSTEVTYTLTELAVKDEVPTKESFNELVSKVDNLSSGGGGIEKLIDFTTTETTVEFQIPIDTDEMADKLLKASELHIFLYIPRDAADTETTTTGNVFVGVVSQGDYHAWFAKFEGVIVPPTATYMTHSRSLAKIFIEPSDSSAERLAVGMQCKKIANASNVNNASSLYQTIVDTRGFKNGGNFFVTGTQNMAAGTRFVLGVRT